MDQPYANREIDSHMNEIRNMFKEHQEDDKKSFAGIINSVNQLTVEVKKTNGSVQNLKLWRAGIVGGMSVISIIIVPILTWALWVLVNIQGQVHSAVDDALSAYTIEK